MKSINLPISIVIPTWNRAEALVKCLDTIYSNCILTNDYEIIICDSYSSDNTEEEIINFIKDNNLNNLRLIQCEHNNVSLKRNIGIKNSKYDYVILLDDDCIPIGKYVENYQLEFSRNESNVILCGQYRTEEEKLKYSNYLKYRDSRNYSQTGFNHDDISEDNYLDYKRIVTGNLGFRKNDVISKNIFFNEKIIGYGGEDVDWAWRLINNGFKLKKTGIKVLHNETSYTISNYRLKHYHFSFGAMPFLIKYNYEAAKGLPTFFLEKHDDAFYNKLIFNLLRFLLNKWFVKLIEFFVLKTDKIKIFYSNTLFRLIILRSYIDGILARKKNTLKQSDTKSNWYRKGYK